MEGLRPNYARGRSVTYVVFTLVLLLGGIPAHRSTWQGNAELHTLFETIATVLGLVTGAMALVRYYTKKSGMFLLLGSGFMGGAVLDGCHALLTSSFFAGHIPSALSSVAPWSGVMSRVFMSLLLCASVVAWKREMRRPTEGHISEIVVYFLVGSWTIVSFLFFTLVRLPPTSSLQLHRLADVVPASFFAWLPSDIYGRASGKLTTLNTGWCFPSSSVPYANVSICRFTAGCLTLNFSPLTPCGLWGTSCC